MGNSLFSRQFLNSAALICILLSSNSLFSQHIVKGHVTGRDDIALQGATITVRGTNNISSTDANGNFTIMATAGNVMEVSFVGYNDYRFVLGNEVELNIALTGTIMNMDDIVVIGYGSAKKKILPVLLDLFLKKTSTKEFLFHQTN